MKRLINRPGRNGKLAARKGSIRRRVKDKIYHPRAVTSDRLDWQAALKERGRLEREAQGFTHLGKWRLEEGDALEVFSGVPSVFAIMERISPGYSRPLWAEQRYGAN